MKMARAKERSLPDGADDRTDGRTICQLKLASLPRLPSSRANWHLALSLPRCSLVPKSTRIDLGKEVSETEEFYTQPIS